MHTGKPLKAGTILGAINHALVEPYIDRAIPI
jgi:hypothetical protein